MNEYQVLGPPKPAPRPRVTKTGHTYYPKDYQEWMARTTEELIEQVGFPYTEECSLLIEIGTEGWTATISPGPKRPPKVRGDLDNQIKSILDALVRADALADDRLVTELVVRMVS